MLEYDYITLEIHLSKENDETRKVYQQSFLLDFLVKTNPLWLSKVIAVLNNLELKNV